MKKSSVAFLQLPIGKAARKWLDGQAAAVVI
jgi:hypothetical protein